MRGHVIDHAPLRGGPDWHALRIVLGTIVVLIVVGVMLGSAVGYGLSWLLKTALSGLGS